MSSPLCKMMGLILSSPSCILKNVRVLAGHYSRSSRLTQYLLDRDAMDYFRAIAAKEEKSERALELTEIIVRMNPAHYTVW